MATTYLPQKVLLVAPHQQASGQTAKAEPRFIPLATVPTQDGKLAAEVLREAHAAGFKGVMIGTQTKGRAGCSTTRARSVLGSGQ
jgi:predicted TIM-barrel fold metal-dependent hydrolase